MRNKPYQVTVTFRAIAAGRDKRSGKDWQPIEINTRALAIEKCVRNSEGKGPLFSPVYHVIIRIHITFPIPSSPAPNSLSPSPPFRFSSSPSGGSRNNSQHLDCTVDELLRLESGSAHSVNCVFVKKYSYTGKRGRPILNGNLHPATRG